MEDSWKTKCSSPWTSVPSSSSQHSEQGARNQEVRPLDSYVAQNSMVFNSSNLGSCRTAKPDLGNSFLSLLSRPSPQLQQKVQPVPCSSSMDSGKLPVQNSNGAFSGDSHGVPLTPIGLIYPHLGNYNMTTGPEQVLVSSAAASTSTYSRFPDMHSIYQMANITCNKETNQRGLHPIGHGNMIGTNSTHPPQGWLSINRADRQHNTTKVQAFQVPSVIGSATSGPVVAYANGCLRVFCLATNGELLLGSKGLLGVVCLCHGMQMSVSKFCEHSGSCIVNPGDAVRLESGETVSQWRRLFFPKYGMKVPDDNSGWDWPEKNPAIVEMENCKVNVPGISKNSQMTKACDPFMGLAKSGQHWNEFISVDNTNNTFSDVIHSSRQTKTQEGCNLPTNSGQNWSNFVSTNNSRTGESVTGNTFGGVMHNVRLGNAQEGWIPPRSTVLTAQGIIMPAPADIQTTHMVKRGSRSSGSEKVREDSGYQSISEYIDFLTKGGDSLLVNQSLGNFKYLGTVSDARRVTDSTVASIIQNDGTTSNFELRLGQPSQQSYDLDGSVISDVQPQPSVAYSDNQMSLSLDPRSHNVFIPRLTEESRQHLQCSSSDALDCQRWNERNLNFRQFAPGDPAKGEPPKGLAKSPQIIFPKHNTLSERDVMAWANNNNYMGTFTSAELLGTSAPLEFPRNRTDGAQVQQNSNFLCPLNGMDRIKGTQHSADNGSYATPKGNSSFHNCHMSNVSSFLGVTSNNHLSSGKAVNGKQSSFWCQSPGVVNDPSNIRNQSHPHGKASFHQGSNCHDGHPRGAINYSTLTSPGLSWPEVSADYPLTSSNCRQNLMRMWSNYESIHPSPHFLDENLRLLEPMQATDPCKQNHVTFPYEVQRQRERMYSRSSVEMQQRLSTSTLGASEEHKEGPYLTSKTDSHECSVKPLQTCCSQYVDGGFEKLAGARGVKSQCNYSTSSQGIIFLSEEPDIVHPPHHDPLGGEVALASVGRTVNNTVTSVEHGICSKKEPSSFINWNCNCAVHTNCFVENSVSRVDALDGSSKAQKENIIVNTSKPVNNHKLQEEKKRNQTENFDMNRVRKDYHTSMWRDVPRKCTKVGNATNPKKPTEIVNASNESQLVETVSKKFDGAQVAESLNEHQMSNMYSGCSAPAVTDVTFEVNNTNSCTVDAEYYGLVNEVVDEGSRIERCWSSDDALDSGKSTETVNISHKLSSAKGGKFALLHGCADTGRIESSFASKKLRKGLRADFSVRESISGTETHINNLKTAKRKKTVKWKRLDTSGLSSVQCDSFQSVGDTDSHSSSSRGTETLNKHYQGWMRTCGVKRKRSTLLAVSSLYQKKDLCKFAEDDKEWEGNGRKELKNDITHLKISALSSQEKPKLRRDPDLSRQFPNQEINQRDTRKAAKSNSDSCAKNFSSNQVDTFDKRTTPVVCGKYGIISNGKLGEDGKITAKVVSLSTILKTARICSTTRTEEPKLTSTAVKKKKSFKRKTKCYSKASVFEDGGRDSENSSIFETKKASLSEDAICLAALSMPAKEENGNSDTVFKQDILYSGAPLKSRFKEARKRSLSELAGKGDDLISFSCLPNNDPEGALRSTFKSHIESLKKVGASKCHGAELSQNPTKKCMKAQKGDAFILDSDASCSVCGSSTRDADNCLLECSSCLIKVHQACYGVSRVPKGHWSCRPCRANSKDNVCVLCGYDGGALTQALKSRNIVKSLLEAWSIASEPMSRDFSPLFETSKDKLKLLHISGSGYKVEAKSGTDQSVSAVLISDSVDGMDVIQTSNVIPSELQVHNSITAGVVDPTIKQWVHMVCGLWTAGTRCPNVDTMSAFDVSGVSLPPDNVVCSMCNRPGGSCIKCRIVQCSVHFHPWCAHQKGLLQSEVEGIDNDMVGFYGRCVLHAKHQCSDSVLNVIGNELDSLGREEFTCARTEGCKGRRKDGFRHKLHKGSDECLVPQEQIDAWLHINTQKPCARGISKLQTSDIEHDCRKEYARYKQVKGWKNLVVYKSGIHGLGLYTSQFISRGAMVVEYVGEIVGLRVADKRELEYHSGKKLQYKAACYFFRIDKEHIIDATRKGGIARFVNHSCLPNCVAKIISVRNDKKVVFFAERDIYPGEEVTYDYHFNHEDEGEKIPCFCSSKNCRQYLN